VYKEFGDVKLHLNFFKPAGWKATDKRAAVVFFFGGGWTGGDPVQFLGHSKHFASRGMAAIAAEYRVRGRHQTTPFESVADGRSAIRWVRRRASELGIDPERIAAGGGSAGGHVALAAATLPDVVDRTTAGPDRLAASPREDADTGGAPNALVLFNPVVDTTKDGSARAWQRIGPRARELSPYHHLAKKPPPSIIFHGTNDETVPIESLRRFRDAVEKLGGRCELVEYDGRGHGFFNLAKGERDYADALRRADLFFVSLGYLEADPALVTPAESAGGQGRRE
jgi:acetyl esterase/lipase